VACSLSASDATGRLAEWEAFVADRVLEVGRAGPEVRLRLRDDDPTLLAAVDLAGREKACCPFLAFSVDVESDGRWLRIAAPPDAAELLAQLFS